MPDAIEPSWFRRINKTPLRDLLRGRANGRLDWKGAIDRTALPLPARALIRHVVAKTRLWTEEKAEVAEELLAHFIDGLESGSSIEQIIVDFGNARQAARLIRRSKKRCRSIWATIAAWLGKALIAFAIIYSILAAQFYFARPAPKVDYVKAINEPSLGIAYGQRAWPLYRRAILATADFKPPDQQWPQDEDCESGGRNWTWMCDWLRRHTAELELIRQASAIPNLGYILGSPEDAAIFPNIPIPKSKDVAPAWGILELPRYRLWQMADFLQSDAQLARQENNGATMKADISALIEMSAQLANSHAGLVLGPSGIDPFYQALEEIESTLLEKPALLSDSDVQSLAHRICRYNRASDFFDVRWDRLEFADAVQRIFSDEGDGQGHVTLQGLRSAGFFSAVSQKLGLDLSQTWYLVGPWQRIVISRRRIVARGNALFDSMQAALNLSMLELPTAPSDEWLKEAGANFRDYVRDWPLLICPTIEQTRRRVERILCLRDGTVVALALDMYHRQRGRYPQTLDELTPLLLPKVPADRINGEPLHYRLINGKPIVYSVGADMRDDGGQPPKRSDPWAAHWDERIDPWAAARQWNVPASQAPRGDWVLYPEPKDNGN